MSELENKTLEENCQKKLDTKKLKFIPSDEINVFIDGKPADLVKIETIPGQSCKEATNLYFKVSE